MGISSAAIRRVLTAHRRSLMVRLVLFGVTLVLLGLLLRIVVLLPYLKTRLIELSSAHQLSIAEYVAKDIDAKIRRREDFLRALAASLPTASLADPRGLERWLKERQDIAPLFDEGLVVIAPDGHGVTDYPELTGRRQLRFDDNDWFLQARREGGIAFGKPIRGRITGHPILVMAVPVRDGRGEVVAVLAGVTELAAPGFLDMLQETHIGKTGGFLLISPRDNLFVASTDPAKVLAPLPPPGINPLHDKAMAGYRGTGITTNLAGIEELSAMVSVPSTGWFLVARVSTSEALAALDSAQAFVVRNGILAAVGLTIFGTMAIRHFFKPLLSASRMIHRMATGEIDLQPVEVVYTDEVGDLAQGFNVLLARLEEATAEKVAAERLRAAESERLERMRRQWMADTSHELRTPIAVLRAQIEAIQDGIHTVNGRRLALLHGEVMGLSRLVDDLYLLARSEVGQLECRRDPVDPLGLVDDAVSAFRERYATAGLAIDWTESAVVPPVVSGDSARLRQVFSNLLENSLRYTDAGGCLRITYSVAAGTLALHFDDTAPGAPAEALPRLFDRFFRADGSRSRERGGSGIGLALCKTLVEAHDGTITAEPSDLGGLRVTILLPCIDGLP